MRNLIASLGLIFSTLISTAPLHAQETTITVGTAGNITATNSLAGNTTSESLSTAQVDGVLRVVAPGAFGQNFTRDRANRVFADFANLRRELASSLIQAVESSDSSLKINSVVINTNALNLRLSQKTNSVSGQIGNLSARVSGRKIIGVPLLCPSANFSLSIDNIKAAGDYNFVTGDISNTIITYDITNIDSGCSGFGFLNFIVNLVNDGLSIGNNIIRSAVMNAVNSQIIFVNMKQIFSLADFANGLRYYGNETIISPLVNRAINVFRELVNDAAINTPGIVLDFKVEFAANAAQQNMISIFASSAPVTSASLPPAGDRIAFSLPPNSLGMEIYGRDSLSQSNWKFLGTANSSPVYFRDLSSLGSAAPIYIVTSRNSIISGLDSFPILVKESNGAGVGAGRK